VTLHYSELYSTGLTDSSYFSAGTQYFRSNTEFVSDWSVAGIPAGFNISQQSWSELNSTDLVQFSLSFDKDNYLSQLKKRLAGKFDPSTLMNSIKNPLDDIIKNARRSLFSELEAVSSNYKGLLDKEILQIKSLPDLFAAEGSALREKFLNQSFLRDIEQKQRLLASLQQRINIGEKVSIEEFNNLQSSVLKLRGVQDMIGKIEQNRNRWEQSGLLKKIKEFGLLKKQIVARLIDDPSTIIKLAKQKLSLSGIQRFFLNMNRLDIGQNALSLSPLSLQHLLSKGISAEIQTNKKALGFVVGRQTDFNSILDYPFTSSPFSNAGVVKAISLASGTGSRSTTNISVSSFSQTMEGLLNQADPASFRQILVTTISNQLVIGEKGLASIELSRSATQYSSMRKPGDSASGGPGNLSRIISTDDFMGNTAISVRYADEYTEQGLSYHINFNKIANGYTNPGNSFLNSGGTEMGMGMRKSFLKDKLLFSFRGNRRVYKYSEMIDASWQNTNMQVDARWKMKKGQYIALRYQPMRMIRKEPNAKTPVSVIERIALDASVYKKLGKIIYRNFFSLAGQKNIYSIGTGSNFKNNSVTISSFQHISIGARMIYMNINYNHAFNSADYVYLNSSLYGEAGFSYQLSRNIMASSGLTYTGTTGWYKQVGIRQTLSGQLGEKFMINIYADLKKNFQVIQPLWNDPVRADISLRYILKNRK
jgi:hypothetical protein